MKLRLVTAGAAAAALAGCVHYAPAPPHPEQFPAAFDARRLEEKPPGAVWTGADLLAAALARNPQISEARAKYQTAVAASRTARLSPGLTLTLTAEYADETPHMGGGGVADIPLDIGGRRASRVTTADLQALQAWYDYAEAVWAVRTAIEKARVEMDYAEADTALAGQLVALRRERLGRLERRVEAGQDNRFLALTAQTELAAAEARQADARGRGEQARLALAKAVGVGPAAVRGLTLAPTAEPPPLGDLPAWRRDAAQSRRDVLRAVADYDLAENALRLEVAKQYPEVRLAPGYNYDHGINKLPFSLSLVLPTYDLNKRAIAQAEAARAASGRSLETVQANAIAAVDAAAEALAIARASAERLAQRELPVARRTAANTARAVDLGGADRIEDLAARAAVLEAELNLLAAQRAVRAAAADLQDALRRSFDPAEATLLQSAMTRPGDAA